MTKLIPILLIFFIFSAAFGVDWDATNFPNPTGSGYAQCNMKSPSMICDPDHVLSESERYRLNYELNQLEASTRQVNLTLVKNTFFWIFCKKIYFGVV